MGILVFLAIITLVVFIHELGHYLAFRAYGIPVKVFSIGIGPKLLRRTDRHGTEWTLSLLPLGGYVSVNEKLVRRPLERAVTAFAGPFANLLAAFCIMGPSLFPLIADAYVATFAALYDLLTFSTTDIIGPVGIANASTTLVGAEGPIIGTIVLFLAVNIGLALFNLLPIPPLDGGHILIAGIEGTFGETRAARFNQVITTSGTLLVLVIFVIVMIRDIF